MKSKNFRNLFLYVLAIFFVFSIWGIVGVKNVEASNVNCGSAKGKNYAYDKTSYSPYVQCSGGARSNNTAFPAQGGSVTWQCFNTIGQRTCDTATAVRAKAPINGSCGSSVDSCLTGSPSSSPADTDTQWLWTCNGQNTGSTSASCSMDKPFCALTHYQCDPGTSWKNIDMGSYWSWKCTDSTGNSNNSVNCSVDKINGVCGGSHYACSSGNSVNNTNGQYAYTWGCNSPNGASNASCSETKINGSCGSSPNNCLSGTSVDTADTSTQYKWSCNSPNGGSSASCATTKPSANGSFSVSPSSNVPYGSRSTISWSAGGSGTYCTESGPWYSGGANSGSGWTNPLTSNTTFGFSCSGPNVQPYSASVTVTVAPANACYPAANPAGYGTACASAPNACGQTQSNGTIQCNGTCSSTTPSNPSGYGTSCTSAPNVCGQRNTGTIQCNGTCSATTPSNSSCTYTLTTSIAGTGSGTVSGNNGNPYSYNTTVSLIPTPNADSTFSSWGGDCNQNGQVTMNSNKTCIANFTRLPAPTASISVTSPIEWGANSTISWSSTNATSCTAYGPWTNNGRLSGSGWSGALTSNTTFQFQCSGNGQTSALQSATVVVNPRVATVDLKVDPDAGGPLSPGYGPYTVYEGTNIRVHWNYGGNNCTFENWTGFNGNSSGWTGEIANQSTTYYFTCRYSYGPDVARSVTVNTIRRPMTGSLTPSSPSCVIASGESTCNVDLNWTVDYPYATWTLIYFNNEAGGNPAYQVSNSTADHISGTQSAVVNYPSRIFSLRNNQNELSVATVTSSCVSGTTRVGGVCTPPTGTISTVPSSCNISAGSNTCNVSLSWNTTNPPSGSTSAVTSNYPNANTVVANGNNGTDVSVAIPYSSSPRTFYLYNNGVLLRQISASSGCVANTQWNGSTSCVLNSYTIGVSSGANGSISPGTTSATHGSSKTYTITPNPGYRIANVLVDGSSVGTSGTYTFSNITANHTISATFILNTYTVTATDNGSPNGSISPSSKTGVGHFSTTTFTVSPNSGYTASASGCGGSLSGNTYTTGAITSDCTVTATFSLIPLPDLTASAPTPSTASTNVAQTFSANISNNGTVSTGSSFRYFFQISTNPDGGPYTDLSSGVTPTLSAGSSRSVTQSYTFTSATTYSIRVCADKTNSGTTTDTDSITESNENNNCSGWTSVVISNSSYPITWTSVNGSAEPASCIYSTTVTPVCTPNPGYYTASCPGAFTCSASNSKTATFVISPKPDLIASAPTQSTASTNVAQTFFSDISNIGNATASGTITHLFQFDSDDDNHNSGITTSTNTTTIAIPASGNAVVNKSHAFSSAGTHYVRVCADNNASFSGTVTESNENNNCSGWTSVTVTNVPVPVVTLTANPTSGTVNVVNPTLTWSATNSPTSCTASGDWSGSKAVSGTNVSQGVLTTVKTYTYTLVCANIGGNSSSVSATVAVSAPAAPTASLTANPNPVDYNSHSTLSWSSTNATTCTAYGPWSNASAPLGPGSGWTDNLTSNTTFQFQCSNASGQTSSMQSVTVSVGSAPANGSCAATHNNCNYPVGGAINISEDASSYTWTCPGSGGGTNDSCSESKSVCVPGQGNPCISGLNSCGEYNSGTIQCDGSCSAVTPSESSCVAQTCQDPNATNLNDPLPCTYPSSNVCQDPAATNFNGTLPCAYPPSDSCSNGATNPSCTTDGGDGACPTNYSGTYPNCVGPAGGVCPVGYSGTYPDCVGFGGGICPVGYTGAYPDCTGPVGGICPPTYTGTYPNCVGPVDGGSYCLDGAMNPPDCDRFRKQPIFIEN